MIRGIDKAFAILDKKIQDKVLSDEARFRLAKEKLIKGNGLSSMFFRCDLDTQYGLELDCDFMIDTKERYYAIKIPMFLRRGIYTYQCPFGLMLKEEFLLSLKQIVEVASLNVVDRIGDLEICFYSGQRIVGLVNNEIVFMFLLSYSSKDFAKYKSNKLSDDILTFNFDISGKDFSFSVGVKDYKII